MAFTNTPTDSTHGVDRIEAQGDAISTSTTSLNPVGPRYVNCYLEAYRQTGGDPKYRVRKRDYLDYDIESYQTTLNTSGNWSNWALATKSQGSSNTLMFVRDNTLYAVETQSNTLYAAGTTSSNLWNSSATLGITSTGEERLYVLQQGSLLFQSTYTGATSSVTAALVAGALVPTKGLVYLNGYLFAVGNAGTGDNRIYNSDPAAAYTTWTSTNYISPEIFSDDIIFIAKHKNHLVAVGRTSTEFFYDGQVEIGSPLVRQEAYSQKQGAMFLGAHIGWVEVGDEIYFIGNIEGEGKCGVFRIKDFKVERISTDYVENRMNYGVTDAANYPFYGLKVIMVNGKPQVSVWMSTGTDYYTVNPQTGQWWVAQWAELDFNKIVGNMVVFNQNATYQSRFISKVTASATFYLGQTTNYASGSVTASVTSDIWDHRSNLYKHIKWVDAIGDYGDNTVALTWYKEPSFTTNATLATLSASSSQMNSYRWRNLGRCRRAAFKLEFAGASNIAHEAVEVAYNMGTW